MARPLNVRKRLKELVDGLLRDALGRPVSRTGKPVTKPSSLGNLTKLSKLRSERPTRDIQEFAFIMEVLANMPAAYAAVRQLSEDVALDESGDPRAWTLSVKVDPLDEEAGTKEKLSEFKSLCQTIFNDYALRTGIGDEAKNYVFKFLTTGDCFAEQSVTMDTATGFGRIEKITELPTWQMFVKWDDAGDLIGYEQRLYKSSAEPDATWNIPAQIIHWKYHPTSYMPYGESIFAHLKGRWEQFKLVEIDTIAAIHTHATDPEVHLLGNSDTGERLTDEQINRYKSELKDNPTDINRFYVGRQGEVEYSFPKTGSSDAVKNLLDTHKDLEARFVEAIVPGQPKSNAFDVTRRAAAVVSSQTYARKVTSVRQDFTRYLRASLYLEFALHGINWIGKPEQYGAKKITLEINWPDLSESQIQREKRVLASWVAGLKSHETSLRELGMNDPDGELDLIQREHEDGDWPIYLPNQGISPSSPNGEQGKGVSTPPGQAAVQGILQSLFLDPEDFRNVIREELQSFIGEGE